MVAYVVALTFEFLVIQQQPNTCIKHGIRAHLIGYLHNFFLCLGQLSFSLMFYWHLGCSRPNAQVKYLTLAD